MMLRPAQTAAVFLLGFVLAWQGVFSLSGGVNANARGTRTSCCCTGCDSTHCATPACCARPSQPSPSSAPIPPSISQNELQALAASAALLLSPPSHPTDDLYTIVSSLLRVATVSIFQRDCSYLI